MRAHAAPTGSRVVYYVQTHTRPAQLKRLVRVITEGSPGALVLIGHDAAGATLDIPGLRSLGNVHLLLQKGGYGDFTHVDRYLEAVDWLDVNGIDYDWLENLTGQCYPVRPVAEIEAALAGLDCDGFLLYSPAFPERVPDGIDQGAAPQYRLARPFDLEMRYDFRHWRLGRHNLAKQRLMRPLMVLNLVQPWVRVSTSFASFGVRRRSTPFGPGFYCYGGSFFCTLRADAARYARDYARANPDLLGFFRTSPAPDEIFLQTVLVNSGKFRFVPQSKRYIDWRGGSHTHPKVLGPGDFEPIMASGNHWARKLDIKRYPRLFDLIDQRVRPGWAG